MAFFRCSCCGGTYEDPQGVLRYFHACPPVLDPSTGRWVERAGHRNENPLDDHQARPHAPRAVASERVSIDAGEPDSRPRDPTTHHPPPTGP